MDIISMSAGAGIGLVCAIIGAWVNHLFALRADRIKRNRDRRDKEAAILRENLMPSSEKLGKLLGDIADPSRRMKEMVQPKLSNEEEKLRELLAPATRTLHEIDTIISNSIYARSSLLLFMEELLEKHQHERKPSSGN